MKDYPARRGLRSRRIYFDTPDSIAPQPTRNTGFYQQLRRDLSGSFQRDGDAQMAGTLAQTLSVDDRQDRCG